MKKKLINNRKIADKTAVTVVIILLFIFGIQSGFYTFRQIYRDSRFMLTHTHDTYDDKMRIYWWTVYDYFQFVKANTPENATIVVPPQMRPWLTSGNIAIGEYFLYPRKLIMGSLYDLPETKFEYVFINHGEWEDAPKDYYDWPKKVILAKQIIYFNPQTKAVKSVIKNFDPSDMQNIGAYGIIEVKN